MTFDAAFGEFPVLRTERLVLREIVPGDAAALYAIFSDAEAMQYYDIEVFTAMSQAGDLVENLRTRRAERKKIRWGITLRGDDTVIGTVGYVWMVERHRWCEVGYDLVRSHWRRGIMAEALEAVVRFGFDRMQLHRVEALVDPRNAGSIGVLEKLGFTREAVMRERFLMKDGYWDDVMYARLAADPVG